MPAAARDLVAEMDRAGVARAMVSQLVTQGGFPQLLLPPVNFDALFAGSAQSADGAGGHEWGFCGGGGADQAAAVHPGAAAGGIEGPGTRFKEEAG